MGAGPGQLIEALRALSVVDITSREEFYWALHAVFVRSPEESLAFRSAFERFWAVEASPRASRGGREGIPLPGGVAPPAGTIAPEDAAAPEPGGEDAVPPEEDGDGHLPGYSHQERLRQKDFDEMTREELDEARRTVARMNFAIESLPSRRYRVDPTGEHVDLRATLRASVRAGAGFVPLERRSRKRKAPPLVVLCDISGSMRSYTRMLLRFTHALTARRRNTHTFLFGTRLTNATRHMRRRDPTEAMEQLVDSVFDFDGGTRIGHALEEFNRRWSRKVLMRGAVVILVTDGLDQQGGEGLSSAMRRLHRSCRRLIWLNPLLRHEGWEPQAAGIRAMIRHVDDLRTIHNLRSLEELAVALQDLGRPRSIHPGWKALPAFD
jgi:uncharacterized protein with von Willebrand factor type A (vWA) domain